MSLQRGWCYIEVNRNVKDIGIKVAADTVVVDDFEEINGTYLSYPDNIPGNYELSSEQNVQEIFCSRRTIFNDQRALGSICSYQMGALN